MAEHSRSEIIFEEIMAKLEILLQRYNLSTSSLHGSVNSTEETIRKPYQLKEEITTSESLDAVASESYTDEMTSLPLQEDIGADAGLDSLSDAVELPTLDEFLSVSEEIEVCPACEMNRSAEAMTLMRNVNVEAIFKNHISAFQNSDGIFPSIDPIEEQSVMDEEASGCVPLQKSCYVPQTQCLGMIRMESMQTRLSCVRQNVSRESPPPKPPDGNLDNGAHSLLLSKTLEQLCRRFYSTPLYHPCHIHSCVGILEQFHTYDCENIMFQVNTTSTTSVTQQCALYGFENLRINIDFSVYAFGHINTAFLAFGHPRLAIVSRLDGFTTLYKGFCGKSYFCVCTEISSRNSMEYNVNRAVWVPVQQMMVPCNVWTSCSRYELHRDLCPKPIDQSTVMVILISPNSVGCLYFMELRYSFAATSTIVCQIMLPSNIKAHSHDISNHSITTSSHVQNVLVDLNFPINLALGCTFFTIISLDSTWHARVDEFGWPLIWLEQQMMTTRILVQILNHVQQAQFEWFPCYVEVINMNFALHCIANWLCESCGYVPMAMFEHIKFQGFLSKVTHSDWNTNNKYWCGWCCSNGFALKPFRDVFFLWGLVNMAQKLFVVGEARSVLILNDKNLLYKCVKQFEEPKVFDTEREKQVLSPNSITLVKLPACSSWTDLDCSCGKMVAAQGVFHNNKKQNIGFAHTRDIDLALKSFDQMSDRNYISWIAKITSGSSDGYVIEVFEELCSCAWERFTRLWGHLSICLHYHQQYYLDFNLEDKVDFKGEGNVMN